MTSCLCLCLLCSAPQVPLPPDSRCCYCHTCTTHRPSYLPLPSVSPGVKVFTPPAVLCVSLPEATVSCASTLHPRDVLFFPALPTLCASALCVCPVSLSVALGLGECSAPGDPRPPPPVRARGLEQEAPTGQGPLSGGSPPISHLSPRLAAGAARHGPGGAVPRQCLLDCGPEARLQAEPQHQVRDHYLLTGRPAPSLTVPLPLGSAVSAPPAAAAATTFTALYLHLRTL